MLSYLKPMTPGPTAPAVVRIAIEKKKNKINF